MNTNNIQNRNLNKYTIKGKWGGGGVSVLDKSLIILLFVLQLKLYGYW